MLFATGTTGTIGQHLNQLVQPLKIDLSKNFHLDKSLNLGNGIVLHLGGIVGEHEVTRDLEYSHNVNVDGTTRLGKMALDSGVQKFIYLSTSHIYKSKSAKLLETDPLEPTSHYAEQKIFAEQQLQKIFKNEPKRLLILRVFSILDWQGKEFTLSGAIRNLIAGQIATINTGSDTRDFLQPVQVAKILQDLAYLDEVFGVFNLCAGVELSIKHVTSAMLRQAGRLDLVDRIQMLNSSNPYIVGNNSKILKYVDLEKLRWEAPSYPK